MRKREEDLFYIAKDATHYLDVIKMMKLVIEKHFFFVSKKTVIVNGCGKTFYKICTL